LEAWLIVLVVVLALIVDLAMLDRRFREYGPGLVIFCWMLFGWGFAIPIYIFFGPSLAGLLFLVWLVSAIAIYLALRLL